ncbi:unnamed protein product [Rhizoctonia solani]|uniref:Uncharacterized protein n=1 Tax=Rhizoctonia solani TaxID=456999 RepID=A0A8H3D3V4_9AGAM|nr:unnamed protein product [Rhizoctonia solani]
MSLNPNSPPPKIYVPRPMIPDTPKLTTIASAQEESHHAFIISRFEPRDGSESSRGLVIGIDLGTTYSCVGIYRHGHVDIVPNGQGHRTTPSWVGFRDEGRSLSVVSILNEPTTAAIAYGLDKKYTHSKIIVYDLGGGTFDVSLLSIHNGIYEVLATAGDSHLGGDDFDNRIIEHFLAEHRSQTGVDVSSIPRAMARLKREAEQAKRTLSTQLAVSIEIESLHNGRDFSVTLTRAKFEQLNIDLFRRTLEPIRRVLDEARLSKADVNEIVLVGGSTRIPRVRQLLKDFFGGKEPSQGIHPDEAVAIGASLRAGVLSGPDELENITLVDVCPFTLGIEMDGTVQIYLWAYETN